MIGIYFLLFPTCDQKEALYKALDYYRAGVVLQFGNII